jgi:hypothetical protein
VIERFLLFLNALTSLDAEDGILFATGAAVFLVFKQPVSPCGDGTRGSAVHRSLCLTWCHADLRQTRCRRHQSAYAWSFGVFILVHFLVDRR